MRLSACFFAKMYYVVHIYAGITVTYKHINAANEERRAERAAEIIMKRLNASVRKLYKS